MNQVPTYDPEAVEVRWQVRWAADHVNEPDLDRPHRPFYNLMMFPYPSAEGLHVGNMFAFTGADIYGRFRRLQGHAVFEPIGFDAFGIHSENYALQVGTHPAKLIPKNIETFRRQLRRFGGMFDWRHELSTTDPRYYKWTQWIFVQLFKAGMALRKKAAVNWCPKDIVARKVGDRAKTGVFLGSYARNPATGESIPIWIADYVLMEYGTGAIMAVPAHDKRDFEFATAFKLPIRTVVRAEAAGAGPLPIVSEDGVLV